MIALLTMMAVAGNLVEVNSRVGYCRPRLVFGVHKDGADHTVDKTKGKGRQVLIVSYLTMQHAGSNAAFDRPYGLYPF